MSPGVMCTAAEARYEARCATLRLRASHRPVLLDALATLHAPWGDPLPFQAAHDYAAALAGLVHAATANAYRYHHA